MHTHWAIDRYIDVRNFWSAWNSKKCLNCADYAGKGRNFRCSNCKDFKGVVWISKRDYGDIVKIANYFGKYFTKDFEDNLTCRNFNQKRYLRSNNLILPGKELVNLSDGTLEKINENSKRNNFEHFEKNMMMAEVILWFMVLMK